MGPGRGGRGPGALTQGPPPKAKNFKKTLYTVWTDYLRRHQVRLIAVTILAIASTVFMVLSPKILGDMTNQVVDGFVAGQAYDQMTKQLPADTKLPAGTTGADLLAKMPANAKKAIPQAQQDALSSIDFSKGRPGIDYGTLGQIGLWLIALYLASSLFSYIQSYLMTDITQNVVYRMRRNISRKINRMPLGYFDTHPYGEVISRVTNDVDTIGQSLNQSATQLITSIVTIVGILIMMLTISWQLTLLAIVILPITMGVVALIVKFSQRYYIGQQASLGEADGHVEEMFSGHAIIRVYNGEDGSIAHFNRTNQKLYVNGWKSQFLSGLLMPIMQFISNLGFVGVAVVGGWLALNGKISIGGIQAFIQYMNQFTQPIMQTANVANVMQATVAAAERVFEFLEETDEPHNDAAATLPERVKGEVVFRDVNFSYTPDKLVIHDFSASIKPGQNVAIVGPTGAGKTTIVNLLMRFYDLDSGSISIDGVKTADVDRASVRRQFGMVLQDTWLFNGTIADNIAYGKPNATRKEVIAAARAAHADHFIRTLPDGYDTMLGEETDTISAGEKQLLTIARAMLADAPMMILDEATSSVDTRTELLIQKAMDKLTKNRTSFVIAHRLSTIRGADLILVMKDGNIVEQGNHNALVGAGGFYQTLYDSQFGDADQLEAGQKAAT